MQGDQSGISQTTHRGYFNESTSGHVLAVYRQGALQEQAIYGSSRLGLYRGGRTGAVRELGSRQYEISNHLGNVLSVVTDHIHLSPDSAWATVVSTTDYYAFGSSMPGRTFQGEEYRYGFQNQEEDDETEYVNYKYRMHNPRTGRFFAVDPLASKYPYNSPYAFSENRVFDGIELEGLEWKPTKDKEGNITNYSWVGYEMQTVVPFKDLQSVAPMGTVPEAALAHKVPWSTDQSMMVTIFTQNKNNEPVINYLFANEYGMVEMPSSGFSYIAYNRNDGKYPSNMTVSYNGYSKLYNKGDVIYDGFGTPENIAQLINLAGKYKSIYSNDMLRIGDLSDEMGNSPLFYDGYKGTWRRHATHFNGTQADLRYLSIGGSTSSPSSWRRGHRSIYLGDGTGNLLRLQRFVNIANSLGFDHIHIGSSIPSDGRPIGEGLHFNGGHDDHIHLGIGTGKK
jgi:RHS repeat-associated protein